MKDTRNKASIIDDLRGDIYLARDIINFNRGCVEVSEILVSHFDLMLSKLKYLSSEVIDE